MKDAKPKRTSQKPLWMRATAALVLALFSSSICPASSFAGIGEGDKQLIEAVKPPTQTVYEVAYGTELMDAGLPDNLQVLFAVPEEVATGSELQFEQSQMESQPVEEQPDGKEPSKEQFTDNSPCADLEPSVNEATVEGKPDSESSEEPVLSNVGDETTIPETLNEPVPETDSPNASTEEATPEEPSTESAEPEIVSTEVTEMNFSGNGAPEEAAQDYIPVPVDWKGEYNPNRSGSYTLTAAFQDNALYYPGEMPSVEVIVGAAELVDDYESMTLEELKELPEEIAGAATMMEQDGLLFSLFSSLRAINSEDWSLDAVYINQENQYDVTETQDFNLKYQVNFHSDLPDLLPGTVTIKIPAKIYTNRAGEDVLPDDIAVPEGTPEEPIPTGNTPFNYYMDEDGNLIFFNYKTIKMGTSTSFQVLYKTQKLMNSIDGTTWSLQPEITINHQEYEEVIDETTGEVIDQTLVNETLETKQSTPLTGVIDSGVALGTVSKAAYQDPGFSYTPGLYTEGQVKRFAGENIAAKFTEDSFHDYYYAVWKVRVTGSATQPWTLSVKDLPSAKGNDGSDIAGELVGYTLENSHAPYLTTGPSSQTGNMISTEPSNKDNVEYRLYVVAAYPNEKLSPGSALQNDIEVIIHPIDGIDSDQMKTSSVKWQYKEYEWLYNGNLIGVEKWNKGMYKEETCFFKGWIDAYKTAQKMNEDYGSLPFMLRSTCRGYDFTHKMTKDSHLGEYIPGTYYKVSTADDLLYAYNANEAGDRVELTDQDYYFSDVTISVADRGYNVWEDNVGEVISETTVDRKVDFYAMYKGSTAWEFVDSIPWDESGVMQYTFTSEQLAREPYRVKAVHNATDYVSNCDISVNVTIRKDSPVIKQLLDSGVTAISIENLASVLGISSTGEVINDGDLYNDVLNYDYYTAVNGYQRDLRTISQQLYENEYAGMDGWSYVAPQRDNAVCNVTMLEKEAYAFNTGTSKNDPVHGRVQVNYNLTAYEGYAITSEADYSFLENNKDLANIAMPHRRSLELYDLLPHGMHYDISKEPKAGRIISDLQDSDLQFTKSPNAWDSSQVTVEMTDYVTNYNNTGRNLVKFTVTYDGAKSDVFQDGMWYEGWGISFGAYYDWKEMQNSVAESNIFAFMPASDDRTPILGKETQVGMDDGVVVSEYPDIIDAITDNDGNSLFGTDINRDGVTDLRNILYAKALVLEDVATASLGELDKKVKADSDPYVEGGSSASVAYGEGYTYTISARAAVDTKMNSITLFDQIESLTDRNEWHGVFVGLDTKNAIEKGASGVTVYYNASRETSTLPVNEVGGTAPNYDLSNILTEANGWYTDAAWRSAGKPLADVKSIAVTMHDLTLEADQSVSIQIHMMAPTLAELGNNTNLINTYNEPHMLATTIGSGASAAPETYFYNQEPVKVSLSDSKTYEIVKEFADEAQVPEPFLDEEFLFTITREGLDRQEYFSDRNYTLYQNDGIGNWIEVPGQYGTNASGSLSLKAGQKAVFTDLAGTDTLSVKEQESIFWNISNTLTEDARTESVTNTFTNTYRPILYLNKVTEAVPEGTNIDGETFTFQVSLWDLATGSWQPAANRTFWYVEKAETTGILPTKVEILGSHGEGKTNREGQVTLKAGETIAIFADSPGQNYQVEEVRMSRNWICKNNKVEGELGDFGSVASITNYWKWKDIILNKTITQQNGEEAARATDVFTFQVTDADGNPVVGNEWVLLDKDGNETATKGILDETGSFSVANAARVVKIKHLPAEETFTVTETGTTENYAMRITSATGEMPLYSFRKALTLENEYLWRDLAVNKIVATNDPAGVTDEVFTFTLTKEDGTPISDAFYTVSDKKPTMESASPEITPTYRTDANGQFTLKDGQTALFQKVAKKGETVVITETPNATYPQIAPAGNAPATVTLTDGENKADFVNGAGSVLMLKKEWQGGVPAADDNNSEQTKGLNNAVANEFAATKAVPITIQVTPKNPLQAGYRYPKTDTEVTVLMNGATQTRIWKSGEQFELGAGETVLITDIPADATYIVEEDASIRDSWESQTIDGFHYLIHVHAKEESLSGTVQEKPIATLVNEVNLYQYPSVEFHKHMTQDSAPVPEEAKLVYRLEEYDEASGTWSPASGQTYLTASGPCNAFQTAMVSLEGSDPSTSGGEHSLFTMMSILTTDSDGLITLEKVSGLEPIVVFPYIEPYLNLYGEEEIAHMLETISPNPMYRLVEVPELSDSAWGTLVGYTDTSSTCPEDLSVGDVFGGTGGNQHQRNAFVNSSAIEYLQLEKALTTGESSSETFDFQLEHVISTEGYSPELKHWVNHDETPFTEYTTDSAGQNISYEIYDSLSGEFVKTASTGVNGIVSLKANQYAKIPVAAMSLWKISEQTPQNHIVDSIDTNASKVVQLDDKSVLVDMWPTESYVVRTEADINPSTTVHNGDALDAHDFTVKKIYNDGTIEVLPSSAYTLETTVVPDVEHFTQVITINETGEKITCEVDVKTIQKLTVDGSNINELYDPATGALIDVYDESTDTLTIPEKVVYHDVAYTVTGFSGDTRDGHSENNVSTKYPNAIKISLPDTLETLGPKTFMEFANLTTINMPRNITLTSGYKMFRDCSSLTNLDVSAWDTSKVTNMSYMFDNCSSLISLDVSAWDTSKVTDMSNMFDNCSSLTSLDVSAWDTSKVTDISNVFDNCSSLTSLDVSAWDTSKVTDMSDMFNTCSSLTSLDVSAWDTSSVTNMSYMFNNCSSLTSLDVSGWDTSKVTEMTYMFYNCSKLISLDVSGFVTSNVKNMCKMFSGCIELTSLDVSGWNTSKVTDMSYMFENCSKLPELNTSNWDTSSNTTMYSMFDGCTALTTIGNPSNWNVSNVTTMHKAFYNCPNLLSLDLSNWNPEKTTSMYQMFYEDSKLTSIGNVGNWNTANVDTFSGMFYRCKALESLDVSGWDTSRVTSFREMFYNCNKLPELDVSRWNTETAGNMRYMFYKCYELDGLDVSGWNTAQVKDMQYMFYDCHSLTALDVSGWDTSNVTNMYLLFYKCSSLPSLDLTNWNTEKVTTMHGMFQSCTALASIGDVSRWNTENVENMYKLFQFCTNLTSLDLSGWNTAKTTNMMYVFNGCTSLTNLDVSGWNTSSVTNMNSIFLGCSSLPTISLPSTWTMLSTDAFDDCTALTVITINRATNAISGAPWSAPNSPTINWTGTV